MGFWVKTAKMNRNDIKTGGDMIQYGLSNNLFFGGVYHAAK